MLRLLPILVLGTATLVIGQGQAFAQGATPGPGGSTPSDPPVPTDRPFGALDSDGNGALTEEELGTIAGLPFDSVDKNGDRRITAEEYRDAKVQRDTRGEVSEPAR